MTTYTYSVSLEFPTTYDDGNYFFHSEDFYTKKKARKCYQFLQSLDIPSTAIHFLKTKCIDTFYTDEDIDEVDEDFTITIDNDSDNHASESHDLSSMAFFPYGKGFILKPHKNSAHYAEKYFLNGYWIDAAHGWFVKEDAKASIEDMGARYVAKRIKTVAETSTKTPAKTSTKTPAKTSTKTPAKTPAKTSIKTSDSQITWKQYGKGYLLIPTDNYQNYGQKYFHGGFWMPKHKAWFFKKDTYETAKNTITDSTTSSSVNWKTYGKGHLLVPQTNDTHYGQKYFHGGFWMPKHSAWFFKNDAYNTYTAQTA